MIKQLLTSVVCILGLLVGSSGIAQNVFINEFHYDNVSGDVNEFVEVAGPAGTDLSDYAIVLYNGSNGTDYNTTTLSGVIPDQQNGFGTLSVLISGIQNGAPDGIVLTDNLNTVLQFISYEGSLMATNGVAIGLTSTDVGVEESGSALETSSIYLSGTGTTAADFIWNVGDVNTAGAINTDQVFGTLVVVPVINEFVLNHTGSDTDEFVEVFAQADTDLSSNWVIAIEGDTSGIGTIDAAFQLGMTDANGYYSIPFQDNAFENGTQTLLLVSNFTGAVGDIVDPAADGTLSVTFWDEILDGVAVRDDGADDITYTDAVLTQDFDGGIFTVGGASRIPNGTDTDASGDWVRNAFNGAGLPSFPTAVAAEGEAISTPSAANEVQPIIPNEDVVLLINEVDADTPGTDMAEFVELYDGGVGNAPLDGYTVVFYNGSDDASYDAYSLDGFTTSASGYFVLGNAAISQASIILDSNGIQNGADAIALYKDSSVVFDVDTPITLENLVDAVVYDTNDADDEGLLILLADGQAQINEDELGNKDELSLQRFANGSGEPRETATYVNAIPTPGAANTNATEPINLIINELDADTAGTDDKEFVEIYDGGSGNTSLSGFVLVAYNGNGDTSYNAFDLDGFTTNSDGYFVVGNAGVFNVDLVVSDNSFQNGADAVALYQGAAANFPNGTAVTTDGLIDAVVYDTNDDDDLELLVLLNAGQPQLNEDVNGSKDSESLQRIPNGAGGARNTDTYAAQIPTPGAANDEIIVPGDVITIAEVRAAAEGTVVTTTGILTVSDQLGGPAYMQDDTGGIAVFGDLVNGDDVFEIGASVTVTGTRSSFNDLVQISPVTVVSVNDPPTGIVEPRTITLAELGQFPGQLVRIENATFPNEGDLLFGSSNFILTDASGSGEMRVDGNVGDLVVLTQPDMCEVIGVVGRFRENFQLLPRMASDIPCAEPYVAPEDTSGVSKDDSFDVTAWNIEWFGDENNSPPAGDPMSDAIQRDSVRAVLRRLDADVIAVEEIADDALFDDLVTGLEGYDYILSDAVSNPGGTPPFQRVGFIYKTSVVTPVTTRPLLQSIHPLYNGGDDSALVDYPSTTDRFYASGRLPFLMTADVTINGTTEQFDLVALHARANRSGDDAKNRYDMRRYDVEVLKDSLDVHFADRNVILLGDYNDDVDVTVSDDVPSGESSFIAYTSDPDNYNIVTSTLSDAGFRSFVSRENMIDHVGITNELYDNYLEGSASVGYQFYDEDYAFTASDHFPVSARFILATIVEPLTIEIAEVFDTSCSDTEDGFAMVTVTGGVQPYAYLWSDGQSGDTAIDLAAGTYSVTVTDANGTQATIEGIEIASPPAIAFTTSEDVTVFQGFDEDCTTLSVSDIVSQEAFTVSWSTGDTGETIEFCPEETTTVSVTVTDTNGCELTKMIQVTVIDVTCGDNPDRPKVQICYNGRSYCVNTFRVQFYLDNGAILGSCDDNPTIVLSRVRVFPNPVRAFANVRLESEIATTVTFEIFDINGLQVFTQTAAVEAGRSVVQLPVSDLAAGFYFLKPTVNGVVQTTKVLIKI